MIAHTGAGALCGCFSAAAEAGASVEEKALVIEGGERSLIRSLRCAFFNRFSSSYLFFLLIGHVLVKGKFKRPHNTDILLP